MSAPALDESRRELAQFDRNRDRDERDTRIHHLNKIGQSAQEIADEVGMSDRHITRLRHRPPPPRRPRLYDGAAATDERVAELESRAELVLELAAVLRDEDPTIVWGTLARLSHRHLMELAVIALAATPVDMTRDQLLGWVSELPAAKEQQ